MENSNVNNETVVMNAVNVNNVLYEETEQYWKDKYNFLSEVLYKRCKSISKSQNGNKYVFTYLVNDYYIIKDVENFDDDDNFLNGRITVMKADEEHYKYNEYEVLFDSEKKIYKDNSIDGFGWYIFLADRYKDEFNFFTKLCNNIHESLEGKEKDEFTFYKDFSSRNDFECKLSVDVWETDELEKKITIGMTLDEDSDVKSFYCNGDDLGTDIFEFMSYIKDELKPYLKD